MGGLFCFTFAGLRGKIQLTNQIANFTLLVVMTAIYETTNEPQVEFILNQMRNKLAKQFGVTITGNRCTVRWQQSGHLVDVHMIIESVTTLDELREEDERSRREEAFFQKYPELRAEWEYAQHGEWTK